MTPALQQRNKKHVLNAEMIVNTFTGNEDELFLLTNSTYSSCNK